MGVEPQRVGEAGVVRDAIKPELGMSRARRRMDRYAWRFYGLHPRDVMTAPPGMDFRSRREVYEGSLGNFLTTCGPLFIATHLPGNIGDHLIAQGTDNFLERRGLHPARVAIDDVQSVTGTRRGTLLVPGSGAMNPLWGDWLPRFLIAASEVFDEVVVLPSGVTSISPLVRQALDLPNVSVIVRDALSFRVVRHTGRSALCMDLAMSCDVFRQPWQPPQHGSRLVALRSDAGSRLAELGLQPEPGENNDISATAEDLDGWLAAIRASEVVITDRLHVVVASVLLGRATFFIEAYNRKIRNYVDFTFRDEFADHLTEVDGEWLVDSGAAVRRPRMAGGGQ